MNILQLLPELNEGGVERCTVETAKALVDAGHQSTVISNGGRMVATLQAQGSAHICLPIHQKSLGSLWQIRPLRKLIQRINPDVIHVRSRMPAWILKFALKGIKNHPKIVSTVHGFNSVNRYSQIMTQADVVIAGSQSVVDFIKTNYPTCPSNRIKLIYEGLNSDDFPYGFKPSDDWWQATYQHFPALRNKILIALPARITRLKGHETFIQLIENLKQNHPIHGIIIGEAAPKKQAYLDELKQLMADKNLSQDISFVGHQSDIKNWLAASDIVLSLSTQAETFGRTVLEAMSLGTPTFAWARGGVAEILAQTFPAGLIEADNLPAMLNALNQQLTAPTRPAKLEQFLLSQMMEDTLGCYQTVLNNKLVYKDTI